LIVMRRQSSVVVLKLWGCGGYWHAVVLVRVAIWLRLRLLELLELLELLLLLLLLGRRAGQQHRSGAVRSVRRSSSLRVVRHSLDHTRLLSSVQVGCGRRRFIMGSIVSAAKDDQGGNERKNCNTANCNSNDRANAETG
jgi:hypothetical protein